MNQKILDLIEQVRSLQGQLQSLNTVLRNEEKTSGERLARTLAKSGVIHIGCNHNTVVQEGNVFSCKNCENNVLLQFGVHLTANELDVVQSAYKDNTKMDELEREMNQLKLKYDPIIDKIKLQIASDLKKAGLIMQCKHENAEMFETNDAHGYCQECREGIDKRNGIFYTDKDDAMIKKVFHTLPINDVSSWDWNRWIK